jgi:hypothetical protein
LWGRPESLPRERLVETDARSEEKAMLKKCDRHFAFNEIYNATPVWTLQLRKPFINQSAFGVVLL